MSVVNIAAGLVIGLALLASTPQIVSDDQSGSLWITTGTGIHNFVVEIAATPEQQSRGLMYRKSMAADHGMLFILRQPRKVSFWMKNTYIPLDMLFLGRDGTILQIDEMTEPLTEDPHRSGMEVTGILEINGGLARELGISVGDKVRHTAFRNLGDCGSESSQMACQQ